MSEKIINDKSVTVILGHYGSGKSEVISNLVLNSNANKKALYDLDIINPYFRNNLIEEKLEKYGIDYISGSVEGLNSDLPSIPNLSNLDQYDEVFIDLGGNEVGVKVLVGYKDQLFPKDKCNFYIVINTNRPETSSELGIKYHIRTIEKYLKEKITGLISNTHLLEETTSDDIIKGYKITKQISKELKIPLIFVTYPEEYVKKESLIEIEDNILYPLKLNLRKSWMSVPK